MANTSSNSNKKRLQFSSNFTTDADSHYERVQNNTTGQVKTTGSSKPSTGNTSITVTSNPLTIDSTRAIQKEGQLPQKEEKHIKGLENYDSSDL